MEASLPLARPAAAAPAAAVPTAPASASGAGAPAVRASVAAVAQSRVVLSNRDLGDQIETYVRGLAVPIHTPKAAAAAYNAVAGLKPGDVLG
jgi:hypothetical protein